MGDEVSLRIKRQTAWRAVPSGQRCASIEISIGNARCSGRYLAAQLSWARDEFAGFEFSIGDTLQIHNYLVLGHPLFGTISDEKARIICLSEGEDWLRGNARMVAEILAPKPYKFVRWDSRLGEPRVKQNLNTITAIYRSDARVRELVRDEVMRYLQRRITGPIPGEDGLRRLDRHVLEELAVYQYQAEVHGLVSLYPGSNPLILRPAVLRATSLPAGLKMRQFVLFDIKLRDIDTPYLTAARPLVDGTKCGGAPPATANRDDAL